MVPSFFFFFNRISDFVEMKLFLVRIMFLFSMCPVANFKTQDDQYATDE